MKTEIKFAMFLTVLLLAVSASADHIIYGGPNGYHSEILPKTIPGVRNNVPASYWLDSGEYWIKTEAEILEWETARSNAIAEADASAKAEAAYPEPHITLPVLNPDTMEETGATATLVALDDGTLTLLATTNSASPKKTWAVQKAALKDSKIKAQTSLSKMVEAIEKENSTKKRWDALFDYLRAKEGLK